jgi:ATP-dependent Clp protease ATP-binding subunit ClpB
MSRKILNTNVNSPKGKDILKAFGTKIVGQREAVNALVDVVENFVGGFCTPGRPAGNLLFLGPTGTGKTRVVEALCEGLFGTERACIKIDCGEFQHSHDIAKLVGSPPGYLGHRETHPMLTQEALNLWHTEKFKFTVLLFDEIEKASDALWNILLGILDKATLTLGDNRRVDFSQCVIVMTSNLGATEMGKMVDERLGFHQQATDTTAVDADLDKRLSAAATAAAKRKFKPEFMNRLDKTVVFHSLTPDHIKEMLEIEISRVQMEIVMHTALPFFFCLSPSAKKVLLAEGYSPKYGGRHLKRAMDRRLKNKFAKLVGTGQITEKCEIVVDADGDKDFIFYKQEGL